MNSFAAEITSYKLRIMHNLFLKNTKLIVSRDSPTEVLLSLQSLLSMPQTEQMSLVDVKRHDLFKELVQRLGSKIAILLNIEMYWCYLVISIWII